MERVDVDKVKVTALKETGVSADAVRKEDAELSAAEDAEDLRKDCRLVLSLPAKLLCTIAVLVQAGAAVGAEVPFLHPSAFLRLQLNINYCVTFQM